jgi:hypothetical protein
MIARLFPDISVCAGFNAGAQKSSWGVPASEAHVKNLLAGNI